jgi:phosphoribosylaminoimidazolecarboxamide formyltransferase/IMP cyclohydrolase
MRIRSALLSVYDKSGIVDFACELERQGIELTATGGTLEILKRAGILSVKHVSEVTGFQDMLGGRIKTCHPKILAGILANRNDKEHMSELKEQGIRPIDMVVCNPYFIEGRHIKETGLDVVLDSIDIGGPNIIRAAAKNFTNVVVIVNPDRYDLVVGELKGNGHISIKTRSLLGIEAFNLTSRYDELITRFFENIL